MGRAVSSAAEQGTFNPRVVGSNPTRPSSKNAGLQKDFFERTVEQLATEYGVDHDHPVTAISDQASAACSSGRRVGSPHPSSDDGPGTGGHGWGDGRGHDHSGRGMDQQHGQHRRGKHVARRGPWPRDPGNRQSPAHNRHEHGLRRLGAPLPACRHRIRRSDRRELANVRDRRDGQPRCGTSRAEVHRLPGRGLPVQGLSRPSSWNWSTTGAPRRTSGRTTCSQVRRWSGKPPTAGMASAFCSRHLVLHLRRIQSDVPDRAIHWRSGCESAPASRQ